MNEALRALESGALFVSPTGVFFFVLIGLGLAVLTRALGKWAQQIPMRQSRRAVVARAVPVAEALIATVYILGGAAWVFSSQSTWTPLVVAFLLIFLFLGVLMQHVIRDFLDGVLVRAGRSCHVGDYVSVGGVGGRVHRLGLSHLVIETDDGSEAVIPYRVLSADAITRTSPTAGAVRHSFVIERPAASAVDHFATLIRRAAMMNHWSTLSRRPAVRVIDDRRLEVVVYALDRIHGPQIEAAVRRAVGPSASGLSGSAAKRA